MKITGHMPEHVRDVYCLLCGKIASIVEDYIYLKYSQQDIVLHSSISEGINASSIAQRMIRTNKADNMIFKVYNIYKPQKHEFYNEVDWSDFELDAYLGRF